MGTLAVSNSKFTDIDLSFTRHPVSRDIMVKKDVESIKVAVRNLLLTSYYPYHPEKESHISDMLFDNYTQFTKAVTSREINNCINNLEPRAILNSVSFSDDITNNGINIVVTFTPSNTTEQVSFSILLERLR